MIWWDDVGWVTPDLVTTHHNSSKCDTEHQHQQTQTKAKSIIKVYIYVYIKVRKDNESEASLDNTLNATWPKYGQMDAKILDPAEFPSRRG